MREIVVAKAGVFPIVGGRWAMGLGVAALLSVAGVEVAHWRASATGADGERVVQMPAPVSKAAPAELSAPDPGDDP